MTARALRVALLLGCALPAAAAADPLALRAQLSSSYDSNLFKLADGLAAPNGRDEIILQALAGARVEANVSLQQFIVDASVSRNSYTAHDQFSYTGISATGTWNWRIGSRLSGNAGYDLQRSQTSFFEIRDAGRNIVTVKQPFVEARYQPGQSLFAYGGYRHADQSNTLTTFKVSDFASDIVSGGLGYMFAKGGEIRLGARRTERRFPNNQTVIVAGVPTSLRNDFRLEEAEVQISYPFSAKTTLAGRVAYTRRTVEQAAGRNFSGVTGRLTLTYQPSELVTFEITPRRELTGLDDVQTNFVTTRSLRGTATWRPRRYIRIALDGQTERREYEGFAITGPASGRVDTSRLIGVSAGYAWQRGNTLGVSIRRESGDSTLNQFSYKSTIANAALSLLF